MRSRINILSLMVVLGLPLRAHADEAVTQPQPTELIALPSEEVAIPEQSAAPVLHSKRASRGKAEFYRVKAPGAEDTGQGQRVIHREGRPKAETTEPSPVTITVGDLPAETDAPTAKTNSARNRIQRPPIRPVPQRVMRYPNTNPTKHQISAPKRPSRPYDRLRQRNRPGGRR